MVDDTIFHLPPHTSILTSYNNLTTMAARRPQPMFRKLPEPIIPVDRVFLSSETLVLSPTSPLERNLWSPKGWKNRDSDGIGLGIVAALEKSGSFAGAPSKLAVASAPIVIASPRTVGYRAGSRDEPEAGCSGRCVAVGPDKNCGDLRWKEMGFFCGSPPLVNEETAVFRPVDFLSHCYLCSKRLFGKDIYMYRGEKAFCSMECRYRQIVSDEFQEKCGREASKPSTDISSSPYSGGDRLFFTGIVAA